MYMSTLRIAHWLAAILKKLSPHRTLTELSRARREPPYHPGWRKVGWWHPARWAGYTHRRWKWDAQSMLAELDGQWEYATTRQCAEIFLRERFQQAGE